MNYTIQTKIVKGEKGKNIQNLLSSYHADSELNVGQIKEMARAKLFNIPETDVTDETLYVMGELKNNNSEVIFQTEGLKYTLFIK